MSFRSSELSQDELDNILLKEKYKVNLEKKVYETVLEEYSSINKAYSETGHLHTGKNTPQYIWFKGSRDRGFKKDIAA